MTDSMLPGAAAAAEPRLDFETLFHDFYRPVLAFFRRRGLPPQEAEELAQETFLRAYRGQGSFRGDADPASWVFVIAANVFRNELRRRRAVRRQRFEVPLERSGGEADGELHPAAADPGRQEDALAARQELRAVAAGILSLPPRMRQIFELRMVQGRKYAEIAELMQVSIQTVKSQIHQARQRLVEVRERAGDGILGEPR